MAKREEERREGIHNKEIQNKEIHNKEKIQKGESFGQTRAATARAQLHSARGRQEVYTRLDAVASADLELVYKSLPFSPVGRGAVQMQVFTDTMTEKHSRQLMEANGSKRNQSQGTKENERLRNKNHLNDRILSKNEGENNLFVLKESEDLNALEKQKAIIKQCSLSMHGGSPENFLKTLTDLPFVDKEDGKSWDVENRERFVSAQMASMNPVLSDHYKNSEVDSREKKKKTLYNRINRAQQEWEQRAQEENENALARAEEARQKKAGRLATYADYCVNRQVKEQLLVEKKYRKSYGLYYTLPTYSTAPISAVPKAYEQYFESASVLSSYPAPSPAYLAPYVRPLDVASSVCPNVKIAQPAHNNSHLLRSSISPFTWFSPHAKAAARQFEITSVAQKNAF